MGKEKTTIAKSDVGTVPAEVTRYPVPMLAPMLKNGMLAVQSDEVADAFLAEMGDEKRAKIPMLPIIKIDHKNEVFLVNGEPQETVEGYPIHIFQSRAYWDKGFKPGSTEPPKCSSPDGLKPFDAPDKQSETCALCPHSQFGTAANDGDGQACRVTTYIALLNPAFAGCPVGILLAPPTSIKEVVGTTRSPGYLSRASQYKNSKGQPAKFFELVWSRFHLEPAGDTHCLLIGEPLGCAENIEEAKAVAIVRKNFKTEMEQVRGQVEGIEA